MAPDFPPFSHLPISIQASNLEGGGGGDNGERFDSATYGRRGVVGLLV